MIDVDLNKTVSEWFVKRHQHNVHALRHQCFDPVKRLLIYPKTLHGSTHILVDKPKHTFNAHFWGWAFHFFQLSLSSYNVKAKHFVFIVVWEFISTLRFLDFSFCQIFRLFKTRLNVLFITLCAQDCFEVIWCVFKHAISVLPHCKLRVVEELNLVFCKQLNITRLRWKLVFTEEKSPDSITEAI